MCWLAFREMMFPIYHRSGGGGGCGGISHLVKGCREAALDPHILSPKPHTFNQKPVPHPLHP